MEENIHDCLQIREIREFILPRMIPNKRYFTLDLTGFLTLANFE